MSSDDQHAVKTESVAQTHRRGSTGDDGGSRLATLGT
jgi:hypothetical protein